MAARGEVLALHKSMLYLLLTQPNWQNSYIMSPWDELPGNVGGRPVSTKSSWLNCEVVNGSVSISCIKITLMGSNKQMVQGLLPGDLARLCRTSLDFFM